MKYKSLAEQFKKENNLNAVIVVDENNEMFISMSKRLKIETFIGLIFTGLLVIAQSEVNVKKD